ncbi:MAG: LacI family DNA-binding transcriptional regulator [Vulcanimicrobiota bacterium]
MTRVTIKTIAEEVGVTHGTVSRALRGDSRVRSETAEAVQEAAERLGYRPSRSARALRTRRTGNLAIVVSYVHDPFYSEVVQAIHDRLFPLHYNLFMAATEFDLERQAEVARTLGEELVDGAFVCCLPGMTPPFQKLAQTVPLVTINCDPTIYPYGVVHQDREAMRLCYQYLLERGHRKIGYLGAVNGGNAERARRGAFTDAAAGMAVPALMRSAEDVKVEAGEAAMRTWLDQGVNDMTALICFNDTVAIGAMKACAEAGVKVPEELSVVGFDDIEMASYVRPALTTFSQPRYEMGRAATEMMMALLAGKSPPAPARFLGKLVERESVANAI